MLLNLFWNRTNCKGCGKLPSRGCLITLNIWMKKNGQLLFSVHSAQTPDGTSTEMIATVAGIQAAGGQRLAVGQEGNVRATTSLFSRLRAPVSLIGPSRAIADSSLDKTAWSRAGEGRKGFGLLGAGAAQASATTAI